MSLAGSRETTIATVSAGAAAAAAPATVLVESNDAESVKTSPQKTGPAISCEDTCDLSSPRRTTLTSSLGPGPATYSSTAHAVEFELQAGSLEEELALEISITQSLAIVDCHTQAGSSGWDG